jgi:hypothetical protein
MKVEASKRKGANPPSVPVTELASPFSITTPYRFDKENELADQRSLAPNTALGQ